MMLKTENRLKKDRDFSWVFKHSRPIYFGNLAFRASQSRQKTGSIRFGFIVSNKIDKRATRRNKLKRYLRGTAREMLPEIRHGTDIVVQVKTAFPYPYQKAEIEKQMREGLRRARIIKQEVSC